jgi:hypothetical protein
MNIRFLGLASLLLAAPLTVTSSPAAPEDRAARLLADGGRIALTDAGPHVSTGTFRIQVATKLGPPDLRLSDGTWLYHHRRVSDSTAQGSLLVQFDAAGRVSALSLATPATVVALRAAAEDQRSRGRLAAN